MVIEDVGRALWGDRWQTEMARALGVHRDTVQDWRTKNYEFRPEFAEKLRSLLSERRDRLRALEDRLFADKEAKVSCLVCGGRIVEHVSGGHYRSYECSKHGIFGVSDSAEACGIWKQDKQVRLAAFQNAKARGGGAIGARNDARPAVLITTYDF